jgi:hypothetical protein
VFDVFASLADPTRLQATLLDFDPQALESLAQRRDALGLERQVTLVDEKLIHLATGQSAHRIADQDLVYSADLIDYFDDASVVKLLDLAHGMLRRGGRLVLGSFHPRNPCRAFMDHVIEWRLEHRTEADIDQLCLASRFGAPCRSARFEAEGVILLAEYVKA